MPQPTPKPPRQTPPPISAPRTERVPQPYQGGPIPERPVIQQKSALYSGIVHILILFFVWFGLPSFFRIDDPEPQVISVVLQPSKKPNAPNDPRPISKNVAPPPPSKVDRPSASKDSATKPVGKPDPKPDPTPAKPQETISPTDAIKKLIEKKPEPPKPDAKPEPVKKPAPAKPAPKKEAKKNEPSLDDILKSTQEQARQEKSDAKPVKPTQKAGALAHSNITNSAPMSASEMSGLINQLNHCWSLDAGAKGADQMKFVILAHLNPDGTPAARPSYLRGNGSMSDPGYKAAVEAGIRAFNARECKPLQGLDPKKYETWKDLEVTFDPSSIY